jgi:hypothetical protein
LILDLERK